MRRRNLTLVLVLTISLIAAATALSAVNAPLLGKFAMKVTITQSSFDPGSVGTVVDRTYRFILQCTSNPCDDVTFKREAADGNFRASSLHRIERGVYEGIEGPTIASCAGGGGGMGTYTFQHHVEIVKRARLPGLDQAKKIKGHSEFAQPDCGATQAIKFVGRSR